MGIGIGRALKKVGRKLDPSGWDSGDWGKALTLGALGSNVLPLAGGIDALTQGGLTKGLLGGALGGMFGGGDGGGSASADQNIAAMLGSNPYQSQGSFGYSPFNVMQSYFQGPQNYRPEYSQMQPYQQQMHSPFMGGGASQQGYGQMASPYMQSRFRSAMQNNDPRGEMWGRRSQNPMQQMEMGNPFYPRQQNPYSQFMQPYQQQWNQPQQQQMQPQPQSQYVGGQGLGGGGWGSMLRDFRSQVSNRRGAMPVQNNKGPASLSGGTPMQRAFAMTQQPGGGGNQQMQQQISGIMPMLRGRMF